MPMSAKSSSGFFKQGNTSENNEKWWVIGENHELSKDPLFKVFLNYSPVSLSIPYILVYKNFFSKRLRISEGKLEVL